MLLFDAKKYCTGQKDGRMDGWVDGDKKGPDRKNNRWGQKRS